MSEQGTTFRPPENDRYEKGQPSVLSTATASLKRFPRLPLGVFPSPVRQINLDNGRHFWVKDDGGCSNIYGGNKLRKLEYILAWAKETEKRTLIVHGDVGSHTVQACGFLGRKAGFEVHAVVFPHKNQSFDSIELTKLREACVCVHKRKSMLTTILYAHWLGRRKNTFVVPLGASTPLATLGHIQAALELMAQVRTGLLPEPRKIFLPFATGGSVAGLLIGLCLAGSETRVVAVRTVEKIIANRRRLERLIKDTLELLGADRCVLAHCLGHLELIDHSHFGRGFRDTTQTTEDAVALGAKNKIHLEPVFSGKAFAAALEALTEFPDGELLFWNTHDKNNDSPRDQ